MSDKEDIILDILEKIHEKTEKITSELGEVKSEQFRQNLVVTEHERRSTASEARLSLLEKDAQFFRNFITTVTVIAGILTFVVEVVLPLIHQ